MQQRMFLARFLFEPTATRRSGRLIASATTSEKDDLKLQPEKRRSPGGKSNLKTRTEEDRSLCMTVERTLSANTGSSSATKSISSRINVRCAQRLLAARRNDSNILTTYVFHWSVMRNLVALGVFSILSVVVFYCAGTDIVKTLSPQGCRMSWMSPSYVLQSAFDRKWTPLAKRYSLWLYREVGWESTELHGSPVLFIPGNAGSSHQVRSIASSAARQYFSAPYQVSTEFQHASYKPLDFFALEFNEDLSAFHGPTLDAETAYAHAAIAYILSLYPPSTTITVLGHSMGGVVATSLLPDPNISALITMSTPHRLPPARLDRRVDAIYTHNQAALANDSTPILSLCGGATDLMVPSESCILTGGGTTNGREPYRRTVFTSALEGSWTGVGHREMVWCHQVRWRIARAALELAAMSSVSPTERGVAMDKWLRDGHTTPPVPSGDGEADEVLDLEKQTMEVKTLPTSQQLTLRSPRGSHIHLMPIPPSSSSASVRREKFVLYLSRGSIPPISPRTPLPLRASIFFCPFQSDSKCSPLAPTALKLIPEPVRGTPFPVPDEGADESEGVVVFEADVHVPPGVEQAYVAVQLSGGDGRGWIVAGFADGEKRFSDIGMLGQLFLTASVSLPRNVLLTEISFPNLLSSSLLVYRLTPVLSHRETCSDAIFPPLLQHSSRPAETHYYPLSSFSPHARPILLHTHASGPFLPSSFQGFNLTIYSSNDDRCTVDEVKITVDWWGTLGRWAGRYAQAAVAWGAGVAAIAIWWAWGVSEKGRPLPPVLDVLAHITSYILPRFLLLSFVVSLFPLPGKYWLGNRGEPTFAMIAPLLLAIVTGLVCVSWTMIGGLAWLVGQVSRRFKRSREDLSISARKNALLSMGIVLLVTLLFIPWQVAFLCAWIYHFYTCALRTFPSTSSTSFPDPAIPLRNCTSTSLNSGSASRAPSPPQIPSGPSTKSYAPLDLQNHNLLLLLFMTWLLPLAAPVLAVWPRGLWLWNGQVPGARYSD
ncbi:hypothetical protein AcW1_004856 [Taiwanofungus camphoratus]|nr:hypothetical protein AcW1_004856 [Antrodia cinnamomea]